MFAVLSLFTLYLLAIGYATRAWQGDTEDAVGEIALNLGIGILLNFWLVLAGLPFAGVFMAGTVLASFGTWNLSRVIGKGRRHARSSGRRRTAAALGLIAYIVALYYFRVLSEPLQAWDARSIWFFHARMIWLADGLRHAGWDHPSIVFSNPDYPKLVPAMAAQLAYLKGFWNEFFPKGALLAVLVPAVMWVFTFRKKTPSFVLLVTTCFFAYNEWLSNGYMDGYLMIYSGLVLLLAGRLIVAPRDFDLQSACCCLGIVFGLKNEGLLFGLCVVLAFSLIFLLASSVRRDLFVGLRRRTGALVIPLIAVGPALTWAVYRAVWGLRNPLTEQPAGAWARLTTRLFDGSSVRLISDFLFIRANGLWVPIAVVIVTMAFVLWQRGRLHAGGLVAAVAAVLHFCGMFAVYLSTPAKLEFHLNTSAFRTMATTRAALFVAMYFFLSDLERGSEPGGSDVLVPGDPIGVAPRVDRARQPLY